MRVCLIVEGAYPYVSGGVSSWIQQFITDFSDIEFVVQTLAVRPDDKREFKYKIPENVREISEIYLLGDDFVRRNKKLKLTVKQYNALNGLLFGGRIAWGELFDLFQTPNLSVNDLLNSEEFLSMVEDNYEKKYSNLIFIDYLWTMRSMYLPLFLMLKTKPIKADMYHSLSTGYAGVFSCLCKHINNKPLLISEHGIYTREREEEIIKSKWVKSIYKDLWIQQFYKCSSVCYDHADAVTALYEDAKEFQIDLGCDKNKIAVINNGINVGRFQNLPQKSPNDKFINIGAVLRITPIKDVITLINAFHLAKQRNSSLKLWIMGSLEEEPEYVKECKGLVKMLNLEDVIFTDKIDVKEYMGKMDFMILSSISEGQPLAILESFAAGRPVISTNVGNCAGLIHGEKDDFGDAGIIAPIMNSEELSNAIIILSEDSKLREKMGKIALKRAQTHYHVQDVNKSYDALYKKLMKRGK